MHTITRNAQNELDLEKNFLPEETLEFLRDRSNFMSVPVGIKRELRRLGFNPRDYFGLLSDFKSVLKKAGFTIDQRKNAKTWLIEGKLPSPRHNYPIRLCFAFGLKGQDALTFLWNVCRVNGFNFRRAEDVIYYYCLENGKDYDAAVDLIERYDKYADCDQLMASDSTKQTRTLRDLFGDPGTLDETDFFELLCSNKKNFIGYSKTAHKEFVGIYSKLKSLLSAKIESYNQYQRDYYNDMQGYNSAASVYPEIVFAFDEISGVSHGAGSTFAVIMENFPQIRYLTEMFRIPAAATDKEHDKARKAFILLFFALYALDLPPDSFYNDFFCALNGKLYKCGYARLYPANPFDWLILKCVKSLDHCDPEEDFNPIELFNEILELLAAEEAQAF